MKIFLFFLVASCASIDKSLAPVPPDAPPLVKDQSENERRLKRFYNDYAKFILKYKEFLRGL